MHLLLMDPLRLPDLLLKPDLLPPEGRPFEVNNRMVFAIAVPMTLAFLTTPLLGLVDTAVVGRLGDAALLGGLAIAAILFDLVFTTFNFLRSSTTGLVAQAMGRDDPTEEQAVFWRSLMISAVAGVAVIAATPLILAAGLAFMGAEGEIAAAASAYLVIRALSAPSSPRQLRHPRLRAWPRHGRHGIAAADRDQWHQYRLVYLVGAWHWTMAFRGLPGPR